MMFVLLFITKLIIFYCRLGKAEKALNCNETSPCVDSILAFQAQALQNHLSRCTKARKVKDWKVILKESQATISLGVDSAPLVSFLGLTVSFLCLNFLYSNIFFIIFGLNFT